MITCFGISAFQIIDNDKSEFLMQSESAVSLLTQMLLIFYTREVVTEENITVEQRTNTLYTVWKSMSHYCAMNLHVQWYILYVPPTMDDKISC